MNETKPEPEDGSQPERGTGQRQDHRAAPPGHQIRVERDDLDESEEAESGEEEQRTSETSDSGE